MLQIGETWVGERATSNSTPYLYTSKELDETGLYYIHARYFDPRTSVWQSVDPAFGKYLPIGDREHDENLPGGGGILNSLNLGLYTYSHQNPIKFIDQDGELVRKKDGSYFEKLLGAGSLDTWWGKLDFHKVQLSTNSGKPVEVEKRVDGRQISTKTFDRNEWGWLLSHGNYTINAKSAQTILSSDGYTRIAGDNVRQGDIFVLRDANGKLVLGGKAHSYTEGVMGIGRSLVGETYNQETGATKLRNLGNEQLEGYKLEFYRKTEADKVIDE